SICQDGVPFEAGARGAPPSSINPKLEIRNKAPIIKSQNPKLVEWARLAWRIWSFDFRYCFEFRVSNFGFMILGFVVPLLPGDSLRSPPAKFHPPPWGGIHHRIYETVYYVEQLANTVTNFPDKPARPAS